MTRQQTLDQSDPETWYEYAGDGDRRVTSQYDPITGAWTLHGNGGAIAAGDSPHELDRWLTEDSGLSPDSLSALSPWAYGEFAWHGRVMTPDDWRAVCHVVSAELSR